jgi:uncharacterized protein (UPF0261 family)
MATTAAIVILVMAEEKWEEASFLMGEIQALGHKAVILDMGLLGKPQGTCDITREEIISLSGYEPSEAARVTDRGQRMPIMVAGAKEKVGRLHSKDAIAGIISIGGNTGTQMATDIMKTLPFGIPKLAVSSGASLPGFASRYIGNADIALMHSVVEIGGLNSLMKNVLYRAAGAICGMVGGSLKAPVSTLGKGERPLVAMTHFGLCEECAVNVRKQLEARGYEVIGFAATGVGDRAMEEIITQQDIFTAVVDLAPGGVGEELLGFSRAAGAYRLESAGRRGIPQIIAPCAVNLGSPLKRKYRPEHHRRKKHDYDASRTFIRLSEEELIKVAGAMADKLNKARGPVRVVIPLGGWSSIDRRGTDFHDAALDRAFVTELKKLLKKDIEVREVDADLETPEFAEAIVRAGDGLL